MARENEAGAVRIFAVDTPRTAETLKAKLLQLVANHTQQLADGYAQDWPDYQRRRGVVQGLKLAIDECNEMTRQEQN